MDKKAALLAGFVFLILTSVPVVAVNAEMYVCVDSAGKTSYTNVINSRNCRPLQQRTGITKRPGGAEFTVRNRGQQRSHLARPISFDQHIRRSSRLYGIDPYLIMAVIKTESDFDQFALSRTGAKGLMQLMPETARELNVHDPFNAYENIDGGTRYLRSMLDLFDGNLTLSLAAYNAGPTLVRRLQKVPRIPETIRYVKKVLTHYRNYRGSIPQSHVRLVVAEDT